VLLETFPLFSYAVTISLRFQLFCSVDWQTR
jgi:hypothetical protein